MDPGGLYLFLGIATLVSARTGGPDGEVARRIRSWWMIVVVFSVALLSNRLILTLLLAFVSFLAFKEYPTIIPTRLADRRVLLWAYLAIPLQYGFIYFNSYGMFLALVPVFLLLWLPMVMVLISEAKGFLSAIGTLQWGAMITIFSISHLAFLPALPADRDTGLGLLFYLLLITELNDVAQYLWGKRFGRRKVLPSVSPGKSVEGLLGGVATTTVLSLLLGPLLTPMSWWLSLAVGLLLAVAGFLGDLTVSALKRDLDLKDSGALIPGHGGILDRIDRLTYTAPLFFRIIRFVFYLPG